MRAADYLLTGSIQRSYEDPYEEVIDADEPMEPIDPEGDPDENPEQERDGEEDPDARVAVGNGTNGVAVIDSNTVKKKAAAAPETKEKRIPDDKRSTTPYMTKYERARVLGTRALQIRWV
jgi:DNA-directed RNA polymerase I, II, and III subunit RPABC2